MIDTEVRELLEAAYARGGRKEATDTLVDHSDAWSGESLIAATRFLRKLFRDEAQGPTV